MFYFYILLNIMFSLCSNGSYCTSKEKLFCLTNIFSGFLFQVHMFSNWKSHILKNDLFNYHLSIILFVKAKLILTTELLLCAISIAFSSKHKS